MTLVHNSVKEKKDENDCTLQQRKFENEQASMRKKYNIIVQKYIDDLVETPKSIYLNDLDE